MVLQFLFIAVIDYVDCVSSPSSAIVGRMQGSRNKRALITIAVFLRLTAMDVCCGPPAL